MTDDDAAKAARKWLDDKDRLVQECPTCGLMWPVDYVPPLCMNERHHHVLKVRPANLNTGPDDGA